MKLSARMLAMVAVVVSMAAMPLLQAQGIAGSSDNAGNGPANSVAPQDVEPQPMAATPAAQEQRGIPKAELFLGYSHFGTGSTNATAGNRMVGLNGGSAALAFNFNRHLAIVADFGGYDDSQLLLTGNGANQPLTVNSSGTAYSYLFGPRLSFLKGERFSPFVQVLGGGVHASAVTVSNCGGSACTPLPAQNAFAMTAGGGLDIRVSHHIAIRAVQAEYMMTRFASVPGGGSASQNDLRLSTGLVFLFGGRRPMPPVQLACNIQPASVYPGDPLTVTATATDLNPKLKAVYSWSTNGGTISGSDATATLTTSGLAPGDYVVSGHLVQGDRPSQQASCTASFTVRAFGPPTIACSADPATVISGGTVVITAQAVSPQNRALTYSYSSTAGTITGDTATATLSTSGVDPGSITATCTAVDDLGKSASSTTSVTVTAPPAAIVPQTSELCSISFARDTRRPVRVDNEAKGCLDDIALQMQHEPGGKLVIVGNYANDEKPESGAERALNVRQYLTDEKGIDAQRIDLRTGTDSGRTVTNIFVPIGATYDDSNTTPVDMTIHRSGEPYGKGHR